MGQVDVHVHARLGGGALHSVDHVARHLRQPRLVVAPALALDAAHIGHYVGGNAAADDADIGARLPVEASQPHGGDGLARRLDGAAAPLGLDTRMRGVPAEGGMEQHQAWRFRHHAADRAGRVEHHSERALEDVIGHMLDADQSGFLRDREEHLVGGERPARRLQELRRVQKGGYRNFVVCADDGRPPVSEHSVCVEVGFERIGQFDGIHVGAERH